MYKIVSYVLMSVGILLILFALHGMYQVFCGGQSAPAVVQIADLTLNMQAGTVVFPASFLNQTINLGLFSVFMFFVAAVGGKIAAIGCQLLKNERIYEALLFINRNSTSEALKKL